VASQALNAKVSYEFPPEGVEWTIAIPEEFIVRVKNPKQSVEQMRA
jgi:hypothetical protein